MAENDFSINDASTTNPAPISGGMGVVYQCLDKVGGVSAAVKVLDFGLAAQIRSSQRRTSGGCGIVSF